jgi:hypothetical protein
MIPALFERMSNRPKWSTDWATRRSTSALLETSAAIAIASLPAALISSTTAAALSVLAS